MTKKINKNVKAPIVKPDFVPLEEMFDKAKTVLLLKLETNKEVSRRVDNLMSVRDSAYKFWGNQLDERWLWKERMEMFKRLQDLTTETYDKLYKVAETFEFEEFKKEEMKDFFEDIVPKVDNINTEEDLLNAAIVFSCVQPYGSQMNQIHQMIMEEIDKRKVYENLD